MGKMLLFGMNMLPIFVLLSSIVSILGKDIPKPMVLTEDNWSDMLQGEWLVKFYAPWCPACKALAPTWEKVAGWSQDLDVNVAQVDVTDNPGLSGRFLVMALPTIYHVKDGAFRTYRGSRAENDIIEYVDDKKYEEIDPISWWKSPGSFHMGALSLFFKASMLIRAMHTHMTDVYNIPVWGSYTIFAIATIIVGLLLGLMLVCCCDTIFPPQARPMPPPGFRPMANGEIKDNDSDMIEDDRDQEEETEPEESSARKRKPRKVSD